MTAYPDTSFLCAIYRLQVNTPAALAWKRACRYPIPVTELLEFEFLQSMRLQVWLHGQDKHKGYGQPEADAMMAHWEADLVTGLMEMVPFDGSAVMRQAASLSARFTALGGHRTLDVLHVATAVHLGAKEFLTFDVRQRKLAAAAGLRVPL